MMKTYDDQVDFYLQKQKIKPFDYSLQDIKRIALQKQDECYPIIHEHKIGLDGATSINISQFAAGNVASAIINNSGDFVGKKVTFSKRYISEFVNNDLIISLSVGQMAATGGAGHGYLNRYDNDLELYSIKITSKSNNQILNSGQQEKVMMFPLMTQIYQKQNYNSKLNTVDQSVYPINNDTFFSGNVQNKAFKKIYRISELLGGNDSYWGQWQYYADDNVQYELVFTPTWTRVPKVELDANTVALVVNEVADPPTAITLKIQQVIYKIPASLRIEFEQSMYYQKYNNIQTLQAQDVSGGLAGATSISFNISVSKKDFGNRLKGLFIGHIQQNNPLQSTDFDLNVFSMGQTNKKIVPRNNLWQCKYISIRAGTQVLLLLDSNEKVVAYFMSVLQYLNIPQDLSKAAILLREDVLDQFSFKENTVFQVELQLQTPVLIANSTLIKDDLFIHCMGELYSIHKQGGFQNFDCSALMI